MSRPNSQDLNQNITIMILLLIETDLVQYAARLFV